MDRAVWRWGLVALGLSCGAAFVAPGAWSALDALRAGDDPVAIAEFQLRDRPADAYGDAIAIALAPNAGRTHDDVDLAVSLVALADQRGIGVSPAQRAAVEAAAQPSLAADARAAWQGFWTGEADTDAELAGVVAADLTGAGDVRDLVVGALAYGRGEPVDSVTIALAAVGLGLTGATVASLGAATPARVGASALKVLNRTQRLAAPLSRQITRLADEAVQAAPFRAMGQAAARLDATAVRAAAMQMATTAPARALGSLAEDLGSLGASIGYRGTARVLARSDDVAQIARVAKVARHHGRGALGVLALVGSSALTVGGIAAALAGWLMAALVWAACASVALVRLSLTILRRVTPQPPQRLKASRNTGS